MKYWLPGQIVHDQWLWLHQRYTYLVLDEFIVMPDHFHAVLVIEPGGNASGALHDLAHIGQKIKPVPELVGAFKTTSSKIIHQAGYSEFRWQRSYYEKIICSDRAMQWIREYIITNPLRWHTPQGPVVTGPLSPRS